jgi:hypothetical protein
MINKSYILKISAIIAFYVGFSIPALSNSSELIFTKKSSLLKTTTQKIPFSEDAIVESYIIPVKHSPTKPTYIKFITHQTLNIISTKIKLKKSNISFSNRFIIFRNLRV